MRMFFKTLFTITNEHFHILAPSPSEGELWLLGTRLCGSQSARLIEDFCEAL
jgi:hypothetical protein